MTLLEVTVATVAGLMLLGVMYRLFHVSSVVDRNVDNRFQAIQSAMVAVEVIKRDLKQLVTLPIEVDARNVQTSPPVAGDRRHPVVISVDGSEIWFLVPAAGSATWRADGRLQADTVHYLPLPARDRPGVFFLQRIVGSGADEQRGGATAAHGSRNVGSVCLRGDREAKRGNPDSLPKGIRFRLLDPFGRGGDRSPDSNFYVEVRLNGTDSEGRESLARLDLSPLDQPSRFVRVRDQTINELMAWAPGAGVLPALATGR